MEQREKRFIQLGVLARALEEPSERDALINFFTNVLLPAEITKKKIAEQVIEEMKNQKIIGGPISFQDLSAQNKVSLDNIKNFLREHFAEKWTQSEIKL